MVGAGASFSGSLDAVVAYKLHASIPATGSITFGDDEYVQGQQPNNNKKLLLLFLLFLCSALPRNRLW